MAIQIINDQYSAVRGFNYQPGYASHGISIWIYEFNKSVVDRELAFGKRHYPAMNTLRIWLSYEAYLVNPVLFITHFDQMLSLADQYGLRVIPTLFNACEGAMPPFSTMTVCQIQYWCSKDEYYDRLIKTYLDDVVVRHADDDRILMWDLFNESAGDRFHFVKRMYDDLKKDGVKAPLTVGTCPEMPSLAINEGASDVLTVHPYYARNAWIKHIGQFTGFLDEVATFANQVNKPVFASETGWGSLDDRERADTLDVELNAITERKMGFLIHMLSHSLVFDGHRPEFGPISEAGYMACVERDGSIRPYHEIINRYM